MEEHAIDHYGYLRNYLALAEANKIVTSYRDIEKLKTSGGSEEDPYDRQYRELITESVTL